MAEEGTKRTVGSAFFAQHPISELEEKSDYWLNEQGRLTQPMVLRGGHTTNGSAGAMRFR